MKPRKTKIKVSMRPVIGEPVGERFRQYCIENHFSFNIAVTLAVSDWLDKQEKMGRVA